MVATAHSAAAPLGHLLEAATGGVCFSLSGSLRWRGSRSAGSNPDLYDQSAAITETGFLGRPACEKEVTCSTRAL